ncbi:zinc finger protein 385B-like [Scyliorhinus torazame]|uniref:zinc finger protein 385B-like n=1 Tax=Scyliorhinus torazame TaxID=75743 RepID=UPI003B5C14E3
MSLGSIHQLKTLPAIGQTHSAMVQHMMDMKPIFSYPFDVPSSIRLFHNVKTTDMVQRAVVSHTLGIHFRPNKRQINSCNICQLCFNSQSQAEAHYKGNKHARMVKGLESNKTKQRGPALRDNANSTVSRTTYTSPTDITEKNIKTAAADVETDRPETLQPVPALLLPQPQPSSTITASTNRTLIVTALAADSELDRLTAIDAGMDNSLSDKESGMKMRYCSLCKVVVNSFSQLQAHNSGNKHKTMIAAQNGSGPIKVYLKPHLKLHRQTTPCSGLQDRIFHCQLCDVCVNSDVQLKQVQCDFGLLCVQYLV